MRYNNDTMVRGSQDVSSVGVNSSPPTHSEIGFSPPIRRLEDISTRGVVIRNKIMANMDTWKPWNRHKAHGQNTLRRSVKECEFVTTNYPM